MKPRTLIGILLFAILTSLVMSTGAWAKKGGNGGGKPGDGDDTPINAALLVSSSGKGDWTHIYGFDLDGQEDRIKRRASGFRFLSMPTVWSADGTKIIWLKNDGGTLNLINADGTNHQVIVSPDDYLDPRIGGQRNLSTTAIDCSESQVNLLYFLGTVTMGADTSEEFFNFDIDNPAQLPIQLTSDPDLRHTTLEVSPDGKRIATWTTEKGSSWSSGRLEIRDACQDDLPVIESWTAEQLGQEAGFLYFARIDWSADDILAIGGHSLLVSEREVWLIDLNSTTNPTAMKLFGNGETIGTGINTDRPSWSPDGLKLAYVLGSEVWVLNTVTGESSFVTSDVWVRDIDWRPNWVANP